MIVRSSLTHTHTHTHTHTAFTSLRPPHTHTTTHTHNYKHLHPHPHPAFHLSPFFLSLTLSLSLSLSLSSPPPHTHILCALPWFHIRSPAPSSHSSSPGCLSCSWQTQNTTAFNSASTLSSFNHVNIQPLLPASVPRHSPGCRGVCKALHRYISGMDRCQAQPLLNT